MNAQPMFASVRLVTGCPYCFSTRSLALGRQPVTKRALTALVGKCPCVRTRAAPTWKSFIFWQWHPTTAGGLAADHVAERTTCTSTWGAHTHSHKNTRSKRAPRIIVRDRDTCCEFGRVCGVKKA